MYPTQKQRTNVFLIWIAGNLLGFVSMSALLSVLPILKSIPGMIPLALFITLPIGLAQWLVLRRLIPLSPSWVLTLPIGWILFWLIAATIPESLWTRVDSESTLTLTTMYVAMGAVVGLLQWLILHGKVSRAGLWIVSSALGVGLGFCLVLITGLINQSEFISYVAVDLVYSIITGSILAWVLLHKVETHHRQKEIIA